jgi:CDP-diacylglycerol--serine O-phosphatidyltransferase
MKAARGSMRRRMRRGVYLLPSALTLGNLFGGFYALIAIYSDEFGTAAVAILVAGVLDVLDGAVARMTGATSEIGVQLDSLSDLVSFGVAPGLLAYVCALKPFGWIGGLAAFAFAACGAFRLARFNVQVHVTDKRYFVGLPIPAAAAVVATGVFFMRGSSAVIIYGRELIRPEVAAAGVLVGVYALGFLMVSRIRYRSLKELEMRKRRPVAILTLLLLALIVVASNPSLFLFILCALYAASGPLRLLPIWAKRRPADTTEHPVPDTHRDG